MPRRPRHFLPKAGTYHLTTRGVAGTTIAVDDVDGVRYLTLLAAIVDEFRWHVEAFCLMHTHHHVVVRTGRGRLSAGMHRLNGLYAQRFNERHARHGHLFGDRFSAWLIESEAHLHAACRYVLLNPVRAGLCARADEWPWSGSRHGRFAE